MKYDLFDFDDTIYHGNSPLHFFKYAYKKGLIKTSHMLKIPFKYLLYALNIISYTDLHVFILSCMKDIPDLEKEIKEFWIEHKKNIKPFYLERKDRSNDVIISASPEYLLRPIIDDLEIKHFIGSDIDIKTGKASRPMCRGEEKVKQFYKNYPDGKVGEAYGNSSHDLPYMRLAENAYMLKGHQIINLKDYKPSIFRRFIRKVRSLYTKGEEIWKYLITGGLTTLISIGSFALFIRVFGLHLIVANVLSWVLAVIFAYCAHRWFIFKSKEKNKGKEFIKFIEGRVFTLLLDTGLMLMLVNLLEFDDVLSKVLVQVVILISNYLISKFFVFKTVQKKID